MMEKDPKDKVEEKKIVVKIRKQEPAAAPLFAEGDVRKIVFEFVSSWIRGDIIIRFPTAAELAKQSPLSIAFPKDPSVNQELKIKEHYVDQLSILAGIKPASPQELNKAVDEVFKMLLMFRSANRIEGKIISNDLEKRLADVEKNQNQMTRLVEQITGHLFKEKKKPAARKKREG
jgi:hypothetical protein